MSASLTEHEHTPALYCITADLLKAVGRKAASTVESRTAPAAEPTPKERT
jgi:hypothetical protein